jgi:hypothetical protein
MIETYLLCSCSLCNGKTDTQNCVGTELCLVWSSIKLDEELINLGLVLDIDVLLDDGGTNHVIYIGNSFCDTLSTPFALISITELAGFMLT